MLKLTMQSHLAGALFFLLAFSAAPPVRATAPGAEPLGDWQGTSTCADKAKFPACNDEVVLYHFTPRAASADTVHVVADKLVNGKFESMGEFDFTYDAKLKAWISEFSNARYHGLWTFHFEHGELTGTLVNLPDRALVRRVSAKRAA